MTELELQKKREVHNTERARIRVVRSRNPEAKAYNRIMEAQLSGLRMKHSDAKEPEPKRSPEIEKPWSRLGRRILNAIGIGG